MIPPDKHLTDTKSRAGGGDFGHLTDVLESAHGIDAALDESLEGEIVGGIRIGRLIGQGGMGRVYVGTEDKPHRTVAVKVMQSRFARPDRLKRFELEAETLGRLEHPGLARIYAFGVYGTGARLRPYFVMEYIRNATTITQFVADRGLPIRDRLVLFSTVCEAVAHVQQNGVIHRDLKPGNILVDGNGQAKVIDFGIARDTSVADNLTRDGEVMGTPDYMSPEHYRLGSRDVDVRADVYSLGVVLYELISGRLPFDLAGKPDYAAGDIVNRADPAPLTAADGTVDADVQAIVARCLSKEPERRYAGASELAADIHRHLAGLPVEARNQPAWEWFCRLCLRHRAMTTAIAVTLVMLLASLGLVTRSYRREFAQRTAANELTTLLEQELERSQHLRQESDQIAAFLTQALQLSKPQTTGAATTLDEWLRHAAAAAQRHSFAANPLQDADLKARVLLTIGTTLVKVGRLRDAITVLRDADQAVATVADGRSFVRANVLSELGLALVQAGRYDRGRDAIRRSIDIAALHLPPSDIALAMLRHNLAATSARLGDCDEAAAELGNIHEALSSRLGTRHERVGVVLTTWGDVLRRHGELAEAEARGREAVEILESAGPGHEVDLAVSLSCLGETCRLRGRPAEAIELLERARHLQEVHVGGEHPSAATTLGRLGAAHHAAADPATTRLATARSLCRRAIAIRDGCGLTDHPETAIVLRSLADVEEAMGDLDEAAECRGRGLAIQRSVLPPGHPETMDAERDLEEFNRRTGRGSRDSRTAKTLRGSSP